MKIIKILDFSSESKEADIIVTDGRYDCLVFAHPFNYREGEDIQTPLAAIFVDNLRITANPVVSIRKTDFDYYSQFCVAKVISKQDDLVAIGGITINLGGDLPSWVNNGDYVEFDCGRLDAS